MQNHKTLTQNSTPRHWGDGLRPNCIQLALLQDQANSLTPRVLVSSCIRWEFNVSLRSSWGFLAIESPVAQRTLSICQSSRWLVLNKINSMHFKQITLLCLAQTRRPSGFVIDVKGTFGFTFGLKGQDTTGRTRVVIPTPRPAESIDQSVSDSGTGTEHNPIKPSLVLANILRKIMVREEPATR